MVQRTSSWHTLKGHINIFYGTIRHSCPECSQPVCLLLAHFPEVEKKTKVRLLCIQPIWTLIMPQPIFWNLIGISRHLSPSQMAYYVNPSYQSVSVRGSAPTLARQQLDKHVPPATIHATTQQLLDSSSSMRPLSYQEKPGDIFLSKAFVSFSSRASTTFTNTSFLTTFPFSFR
jgi:hypothetical protein